MDQIVEDLVSKYYVVLKDLVIIIGEKFFFGNNEVIKIGI